jgi:hypothetical protein
MSAVVVGAVKDDIVDRVVSAEKIST